MWCARPCSPSSSPSSSHIPLPTKSVKKSRFAPDLSFIDDTEMYYVFDMWCRGKSKKYKNQIQVESGFKKLSNLSNNDVTIATEIVEYSLAGSYDGLFPLKEKPSPL